MRAVFIAVKALKQCESLPRSTDFPMLGCSDVESTIGTNRDSAFINAPTRLNQSTTENFAFVHVAITTRSIEVCRLKDRRDYWRRVKFIRSTGLLILRRSRMVKSSLVRSSSGVLDQTEACYFSSRYATEPRFGRNRVDGRKFLAELPRGSSRIRMLKDNSVRMVSL